MTATARARATSSHLPIPASSTVLPPVERRAAIPAGFSAGGMAVGIKASGRPDLAIIRATGGPAAAAAVFTPNAFAAAPVRLSQTHLAATSRNASGRYGWAEAIVSTSGCANAATGAAGDTDQAIIASRLAGAFRLAVTTGTLHLSTGIIGTRLPIDAVGDGIDRLARMLKASDEGFAAAAEALRTTDSVVKVATTVIELPDTDGRPVAVRVSGMAKGVGMIHPQMATMLSVILTDAAATPEVLSGLLRPAAARTWNQLSIDGDTSTNDTVFLLASGASGAAPVGAGSAADALGGAIEAVARDLARQQAADGEGATTLITAVVSGAHNDAEARAVARAVVSSSLVKAAAHGRDPNWGRIAGAAGNARLAPAPVLEAGGMTHKQAKSRAGTPVQLDPATLRITIAGRVVFDGTLGGPVEFDRAATRAAMNRPEVVIGLQLGIGTGRGEAFGCDLTETYVIENSEYTT